MSAKYKKLLITCSYILTGTGNYQSLIPTFSQVQETTDHWFLHCHSKLLDNAGMSDQ